MRSINWFIIPLAAPLRRLRSDSNGVVAVVIALTIPLLLGFAALAVDTSVWSSAKNSTQGAADAAAVSAVAAATAGSSWAQIQNEANASSALAGFTNGQGGVTVTVNTPPTSGNYTASTYKNSAYEVIITQPQKRFFAGVLGAAPTISGRAVALVAGKPACILALDSKASGSASNDVGISGGATITATKCAVAANSSSSTAVSLSGGSSLTASNLNVVGNYSVSGGATVTATIKTGAAATVDPYASLAVPSFTTSGCLPAVNLSGGATKTISAGCYAGINVSGGSKLTMNSGNYVINGGSPPGISLSGGSTVTMGSGVYIINAGTFALSGGNTITGSGVSIVLTNTPSNPSTSNWGSVTISGGANLTLTAPSSGPMQGVAFYMDRNAPGPNTTPSGTTDGFSGGSSMSITGSLYLPSQLVSYSGGSSTGSECLQLIADNILFSGGSSFGVSCGSLTVPGFQSSVTKGVPAE
ncbi:MAG: pilus assembly protein TadG-related protein [Methylocella sp.]